MERTKFDSQQRIPDAINKSLTSNFTQVPNDILRSPNLSAKAKTILFILLSNQYGWTTYQTTLQKMMKEGATAIANGVAELQRAGCLMKLRYRDIQTKQVKGALWAYTDMPYQFGSMEDTNQMLRKNGLELFPGDIERQTELIQSHTPENPGDGKPGDGTQGDGNQRLIIHNNNNTNYNNINLSGDEIPGSSIDGKNELIPPIKERNKEFLPLAKKLSEIIQSNKNIKYPTHTLYNWADEIRKLVESNGVTRQRIDDSLDWYAKNIGGQYVPVIESGTSLRSKFIKLEDAIKRSKSNGHERPYKIKRAVHAPEGKYAN